MDAAAEVQFETFVLEGQGPDEKCARKVRFVGRLVVAGNPYIYVTNIYVTKSRKVVVQMDASNGDTGIKVFDSFDKFRTAVQRWGGAGKPSAADLRQVAEAVGEDID